MNQYALLVVFLCLGGLPSIASQVESNRSAQADNAVMPAIERVLPCVVKLYGGRFGMDHGYGVGVIVSHDGLVVTASSVLLDARGLRATLHDGRNVKAELVRQDDELQLALVRVDATGLPFLTPSPSTTLLPGDTILALGNSYQVSEGDEPLSVTRGVFSMRSTLKARRRKQRFEYDQDVLIYDAITSNPGMAGGPLLDLDGRWVGLVGKVVVSDLTNTYMSYAVPSEPVVSFLGAATGAPASAPVQASSESRKSAWTGIKLFEMGLRHSAAYVDKVAPNSPAAAAGLRTDDLILAVDGAPVRSAAEFRRIVARAVPGQRLSLAVKRGAEVMMIDLTVAAAP